MINENIKRIFGENAPPEYSAQVQVMSENAKNWRRMNNREAYIVWPEMVVIGPISDAVKQRFVKTNPAGLDLLKALWPWDKDTEPTVTMCKVALELSDL